MIRQPQDDDAVVVENVSKSFVLTHNRVISLKGRFIGLFRDRWRQQSELFTALADVSFRVGRSEAFALMGPNGAGKSTLLQIIAGILQPTSGQVLTRGRVMSLIGLGVGFSPELTGEENIYLNASLFGFDNRDIGVCADSFLIFDESNAGNPDVFKRGFAVALTALATGMPVDVWSYGPDDCRSPAGIWIGE